MATYFKARCLGKPMKTRSQKRLSHGRSQRKNSLHNFFFKKHLKAAKDGWSQLMQTPLSTFITCMVIALTLLLAVILLSSMKTFVHIAEKLHASNQVTLYLKSTSQESEIKNWTNQLTLNPLISEIAYISPGQALRELTEQTDYKTILSDMDDNPLPPVVLIKLKAQDKEGVETLVTILKNTPLVETIHLDFKWLERLLALLSLANRVTYLLSCLFGVGIILIVSHTIQGATQKNHKEMILLDLIGAQLSYIRRPLLYLGSFLGLGAGLITLLLLYLLLFILKHPINELLQSYNFQSSFVILNLPPSFRILIFSTFLGWLGAWIAFYKYSMHL